MAKFTLDNDSILTEVKNFELIRGFEQKRLNITVHKIIAGCDHVGIYKAIPNMIIKNARSEYTAIGNSEEEALTKCLNLIKGVSIEKIMDDMV